MQTPNFSLKHTAQDAWKSQDSEYKILWISFLPPTRSPHDAGSQSFSYYFYNICNDNRFNVKLIANVPRDLNALEEENSKYDHRFIFTKNDSIFKKLCNIESKINPYTKYADLISNYLAKKFISELKGLKETGYSPDVVILEWTQTVVLADIVKKLFPFAKIVATEQDVAFVGYERKAEYYRGARGLISKVRAKTEKNLEIRSLELCDLVIPMNTDNGALLIREGIDPDVIWGMSPYFHSMLSLKRTPNTRDILFFGAMNREENILSVKWFVHEVMPLLDKGFRFVILGGNPTDDVRRLASERIVVTGFVQDTDPYFAECLCMVVPLVLGAGIKVKVLEGLSAGIPVVSNEIGIEGIHAENGKDYLAAESPEEFSRSITRLRDEPGLADRLSVSSRNYMLEHFSYENSLVGYKERLLALSRNGRG